MEKTELRSLLAESICTVKFEKTDGTMREMRCTLMPQFLPPVSSTESLMPRDKREENPNVLAVLDLEKGDWRSFRVSSVKEVSVLFPYDNEGVKYAAPTQE